MPDEITEKNETMNRRLEYLVPLLSFGGAFLGLFIWMNALPTDVRITIAGCLLASCVLAYLAWIRQRKDIVALTTPLYSIIFLGFPLDDVATIVLEFLYAVSLTILIVRLRYRFGTPVAEQLDKSRLAEPVRSYVGKTWETLASTGQEPAHSAAMVVVRFATGDYVDAARFAGSAMVKTNDATAPRAVQTAFAIIKEQAERLDNSFPAPEHFTMFSPDDAGVLAKIPDMDAATGEQYDTALENALILLFACAWIASEEDRENLIRYQDFVAKLLS